MAHVSCHSSSQNVGACVLYTKQQKCSYKPILKEKIHVLMEAFPLDMESH